MRNKNIVMIFRFAAWDVGKPRPIWASAEPCWRGSGHRRFAWVGGGSMTGLTSTGGWITISPEGGP